MMSSDKWVPEEGETYWTYGSDKKVVSGLWRGDLRCLLHWGRVFKTQGQAQVACDEYFGRTTVPPGDEAADDPAVAPAPAPAPGTVTRQLVPETGGFYWAFTEFSGGAVVHSILWDGDFIDKLRLREGRVFGTKKEAEEACAAYLAMKAATPADSAPVAEQQAEGRKDDQGKAPWGLLPFDAVGQIVEVLRFGAQKYSPRNWEAGMDWNRPFDACLRHLTAWWGGEDKDPETGLSHLAHAGCCVMFLLAYSRRGVGKDNRPKKMY